MINSIQAVVLAAGKSNRFNTGKTKLIEKICGKEMIVYPLSVLAQMDIATTIVVGFQKEQVLDAITEKNIAVSCIEQEEQLGTGHAIICTRNEWYKDHILIMNGDMPLITQDIIESLYEEHIKTDATISFVIAHHAEPYHSYGRVINDESGIRIIEAKEVASLKLQEECCINAGLYIVKRSFLESHIKDIEQSEKTKEFYITDLINIASQAREKVSTVSAPFDRIRGINNLQELWAAEQIKRSELIKYWMEQGVRFAAAQTVHIDLDATIGAGSFIGCSVHIMQGAKIGNNCTIDSFSIIEDSIIEDNVHVLSHSLIIKSTLQSNTQVGPFAHVNQSTVSAEAIIGNFVEVNRTTIGQKTKAKHLAYLGDATVGERVNIGAGTITCNHNSVKKNKTHIHDNAYIGSNSSLIAPVVVGEGAFTAAGSVITKDVPANALAIARSRQENKLEYAHIVRAKAAGATIEEKKEQQDQPNALFKGATVDHTTTI